MSFLDFRKHFEEKGIKEHTVYSDLSGFKNKAFMDALDGDYSALKSKILNPLAQEFQDYVKSNRTSLDLKVEGIISGETFTAKEALQNGLIDSIGDMNDAIKVVRALSAAYSLKS
jgi:protease-4